MLHPVSTTYVWPEIGAVPFGAVGTVRVKPPSTAVALRHQSVSIKNPQVNFRIGGKDLRSEDGAGDGDEGAVDLGFAVGGSDDRAGGQEGDFGPHGNVAVLGRGGEFWESLKGDDALTVIFTCAAQRNGKCMYLP